MVAFKADYNKSNEEMANHALKKMSEGRCDLVVAIDVGRKGSEMGSETNEIVVDKEKNIVFLPLQKKFDCEKVIRTSNRWIAIIKSCDRLFKIVSMHII